MDPLSVTGSIIAVLQLTSSVINYLNDLKNASKEQARCAVEASELFSLLTNLRYRLEEAKSDDPWFIGVRSLSIENGPLDQFKIALEQLMPRVTPTNRLKEVRDGLAWKFIKKDVESTLARIERLKILIQIALEMDHFKLSRAIKDDTDYVREGVTELVNGVKAIHLSQDDQRHRTIADWLSPIDYATQQTDYIGRRQGGSGLWFLNSPEFAKWLSETKKTLFCPGIPGAGKTMMAAIAVDHLWKTHRDNTTGIAYLYCNYKRHEEQKAVDLLASLLKQLVQEQPTLSKEVAALYDSHVGRRTRPSFDELSKVLHSVVTSYPRAFIVIDALDECMDGDGTRRALLSEIRNLQALSNTSLMVTSRHIPHITQEFQHDIRLEVRASEEDVERYIEGQMARLPGCVLRNASLQQLIKREIVNAVDGMFLLAQLHLDSLTDKMTVKAIRRALEKLPKGSEALHEAYGEAMKRINSQARGHRELAEAVLTWITCAKRPLKTRELQHALAVEVDSPELDETGIPDLEDMVSVCAGLVTVEEESSIIRLVHYTTQEYFDIIRDSSFPNAPRYTATICLAYLSLDAFQTNDCHDDPEFESLVERYPFLKYAADNWYKHANGLEEAVRDVASGFLLNTTKVACAIEGMKPDNRFEARTHVFAPRSSGLHLAATLGLGIIAASLINNGIAADAEDEWGRTPLHLAADNGCERVIELLLGRDDVDINSKTTAAFTPLSYAADGGHETVAKLLLAQDAVDVNSKDGSDRTPLFIAAERGHGTVVKLLVNRNDVDVNSKCRLGRTPLSVAAHAGYETIVRLLLGRHDVDVNSKDEEGRTPLSDAAKQGHDRVVTLLLSRGDVDVNSETNEGHTPLYLATSSGHEKVVEVLLERVDVEVNPRDPKYGRTPLFCAAEDGHETIAQLLVDRGAEVNARSRTGQTPLHEAVRNGQLNVIRFLLSRSADPLIMDQYGRTCMDWASLYPESLEAMTSYPGEISFTSPTTTAMTLSRTIVILAKQLSGFQSPYQSASLFTELGHCLLFLDDFQEARTAFEQNIVYLGQGGRQNIEEWEDEHQEREDSGWLIYVHLFRCNLCEAIMGGSRFVCATCLDIDLCPKCIEEYSERGPVRNCKGHGFLRISGEEWHKLRKLNKGKENVNADGETRDQWLERLARKYDV